jgi:chemotaxis signal transduction protein
LAVALPYRWARAVVDEYTLAAVPLAPAWLAGAANVEGRVVAVVDLLAWATPDAAPALTSKTRLLLGGDGTAAFALRFEGLPALLHPEPGQAELATLPERLRPFVQGVARAEGAAGHWPLLNIEALAQAWGDELAH